MKPNPSIIAILLATALAARAQEAAAPAETALNPSHLPLTPASVETLPEGHPLFVAPFVPPAPQEPKQMPAINVEDSAEALMENRRQLRIVRAEPSTLPDLGSIRREIAATKAEQAAEAIRMAALPRPAPEAPQRIISLGATVFGNGVNHVTLPDGEGNAIAAVCGFDVSLLAGLSAFKAGNADVSLNLTPGFLIAARDCGDAAFVFPALDVAPGAISFPGGRPDANALADFETIRDLIENERPRLIAFQEKRRIREAAQLEWHAKNPEPPRDHAIWLRPHTGSRYLAEVPETPASGTSRQGGTK